MKLSDIVKLFDDEKELKVKKYFEDLLNKDVEVRLRVTDPRINLYSIYVELTEDLVNKLNETFEGIVINKDDNSNITTINSTLSMRIGFIIFNVKPENMQKLIKQHDDEHEESLKRIKEDHIIF